MAQSSNVRELRTAEVLPLQRAFAVDEPTPSVVERDDIVKGYEFEKGKFVLLTPDELRGAAGGVTADDRYRFLRATGND